MIHTVQILGLPITLGSQSELEQVLIDKLHQKRFCQIITVNPEFIVASQRNSNFFRLLQEADVRLADGVGLIWAAKGTRQPASFSQRFTGVDITKQLLSIAEREGLSTLLVVAEHGLTSKEKISQTISRQWPQLKFALAFPSEVIDNSIERRLVIVGLGSPTQEFWIRDRRSQFPQAVAVGVGGTFDFLSGTIQRAPKMLRTVGLEWLWRLIMQPENRWRRFKRIVTATVIFPLYIFGFKKAK